MWHKRTDVNSDEQHAADREIEPDDDDNDDDDEKDEEEEEDNNVVQIWCDNV